MSEETEYQAEPDDEFAEDDTCKPLLCWADGELGYIWDWDPDGRVSGIFADLHDFEGIGTKVVLTNGVPSESDIPHGMTDYLAENSDVATHEVIVLTRKDIDLLVDTAETMRENASGPLDDMVAGMLEAIVLFMEAEVRRDVFLFARTL